MNHPIWTPVAPSCSTSDTALCSRSGRAAEHDQILGTRNSYGRPKESSSVCWFTLQMAAMSRLQPGTRSVIQLSHMGGRVQAPTPCSTDILRPLTRSWAEVEQLRQELAPTWDADIVGDGFISHATMLARSSSFKN